MLFIIIIIIMYAGLLFLLKGDKDTQIKKVSIYYPEDSGFNKVIDIQKNKLSLIYYKTLTSVIFFKLICSIALAFIRHAIIALLWLPVGFFTVVTLYGCLNPSAVAGDAAISLSEFFMLMHNDFPALWGMAIITKGIHAILTGNVITVFERKIRYIFTLKFCEITKTPYLINVEAWVIL